ncbi:MAG TPA: recombinase family protein [Caulobacteraceae bacterium]|jgi:DNA invertase Pin-like site-specific DNA recombinase|nr:recombinase family protein [Caulobacteraceae bacterium]
MSKEFFGYIRVSTKKQGDGASLPEQKAAIEAFALKHGLTITKWFCDMQTAAKTGRREFTQMMGELRRGRAAGVIVHKIDRSARNARDWVDVCDLVDRDIEVRFAHDDIDLTTRAGRLTADILAAIAGDFIRNNREQVKLCMEGWVKQGYFPWPAPLGYLNRGKHQLKAVDPVRGPLMRQAFELYASGKYGLDELREELARRGLRRNDGSPIGRNTLALALRNPFYAGLIRLRGEIFEGKHEPLVSQKLFDHVQSVLDGRVFAREPQAEFTFRRLLRCGACPRTLTAERQKGHAYYRCHSRTCRGISFSGTMLDTQIVQPVLALLTFNGEEMRHLKDFATELQRREEEGTIARVATHERDLANIAERLRKLTDALIDGLLDRETFQERKADLLVQRRRLTEAVRDDGPARFWENLLSRFELGNTALTLYSQANEDERRELLISLGSNFVARGKDIEFTMAFPFQDVAKHRLRSFSAPSRTHIRTQMSKTRIRALLRTLGDAQQKSPTSAASGAFEGPDGKQTLPGASLAA